MDQLIQIVSGFILGLAVLTPIVLKLKGILKEVGELMVDASEALEDGKLSQAEIKNIVDDAKDILGLFKK